MKTKTIQIKGVPQATLDAVVARAKARAVAAGMPAKVTQADAILLALEEVAAMAQVVEEVEDEAEEDEAEEER